MKLLGNYLLAETYKSVAMLSLITVLSLLIPPLTYIISATPFALITLRKGGKYSVHVLIYTFLIISIFGYFSRIGVGMGSAFTASIWGPVWISSMILRITESQALSVLVAGGVGVVFILLLVPFNEDINDWWQSSINAVLDRSLSSAEISQVQTVLDSLLPMISGIIAAGIVISLVSSVLLARAWQSALFNPGGFWPEFYKLSLPRWLSFVTLICIAIGLSGIEGLSWLALNILAVLTVMHVIQGIASVHRIVQIRKLSRTWLIFMYCFLIFMPQMALLIAFIGIADSLKSNNQTPPADP